MPDAVRQAALLGFWDIEAAVQRFERDIEETAYTRMHEAREELLATVKNVLERVAGAAEAERSAAA